MAVTTNDLTKKDHLGIKVNINLYFLNILSDYERALWVDFGEKPKFPTSGQTRSHQFDTTKPFNLNCFTI